MTHPIDTIDDISNCANDIYENVLRDQVETDENIGKILVFNVDTGDYAIDADGIVANDRLRTNHPDTNPMALFAIRVGYDAVYSFGGAGIHRTGSKVETASDYSTQRHEWLHGCDVETLATQLQHRRNDQMNNTITQPRLSNEEISRRGEELYARDLRAILETDDNIGRIVALDINTGDYELDEFSLPAANRLRARKPDAIVYALRIGYDAVYAMGGTLTRTKQ